VFKNDSDAVFIVLTFKQFAVLLHRYTQPSPFSAAFIDPGLKVAW
jgi:hypothetical protein